MPSAFIPTVRSYPAMPLARQLAHQRYVPRNPLVLARKPLKIPPPAADRDRPVSRRSKPSSRTAFIGEQPNPWELGLPRLLVGQDYTITVALPVARQAVGAGRVNGGRSHRSLQAPQRGARISRYGS